MPAPRADLTDAENADASESTEEAGRTAWYLYDLAKGSVIEKPTEIVGIIRSTPETPRCCINEQVTLAEIRAKIEKHIKNSYLKKVQAPVGVKPVSKAWMEVS